LFAHLCRFKPTFNVGLNPQCMWGQPHIYDGSTPHSCWVHIIRGRPYIFCGVDSTYFVGRPYIFILWVDPTYFVGGPYIFWGWTLHILWVDPAYFVGLTLHISGAPRYWLG
jgi:hypothetical protein